jgi:hypothetical protein
MRGAQVVAVFPPGYGFVPVAATPVRVLVWWRWHRGEWPLFPKAEVVLAASLVMQRWFLHSLQLHNRKQSAINYSVLVHAALGGGWPRWQPLNDCTVTQPY